MRDSHLQTAGTDFLDIDRYSADDRPISSRTIPGVGLRVVVISATPDSGSHAARLELQLFLPVYLASYVEEERNFTLSFNGYPSRPVSLSSSEVVCAYSGLL
jgi:hypothetical protein